MKWIGQNIDLIQREMEYWQAPGLTLTVVGDGGKAETAAFGWRDRGRMLKARPDTVFGVASCSKSMTAAMIAVLCSRGELELDAPIRRYAPELRLYDEEASEQVTLRDMLCHRTGLGGHDGVWPDSISRRELAQRVRFLKPSAAFRSRFQYSNLIYAMAGYVAERATGACWETLMKELVFQPLGMDRTTCTALELREDENHAAPYRVADGVLRRLPVWDVDLAGPAASVNSTAEDMAKWLRFHLDGGISPRGERLISEELFAELHRGQIDYPDSSGMGEGFFPCDSYGLGWASGRYRGRLFQKHTGKIDGYSSIQAYLPEEKIGAAILMNLHSPAVPILYGLLYTVLDQMLGLPDVRWTRRFHSEEPPGRSAYQDCEMDLTKDLETGGDEEPGCGLWPWEEEVSGVYENPGYGRLRIRRGGRGARVDFRDMRDLPLTRIQGDWFRVDGVKEDIYTMRVPLILVRQERAEGKGGRKSGAVIGLRIRLEPLVEEIAFSKIQQGEESQKRRLKKEAEDGEIWKSGFTSAQISRASQV